MQTKLSIIPIAILLLTPLFSQAVSYSYTSTYSSNTSTSSSSADGRASVSIQQNILASTNSEVTTSGNEKVSTSSQQYSEIHLEATSGGTTQTGANGKNGTDGVDGADVTAKISQSDKRVSMVLTGVATCRI